MGTQPLYDLAPLGQVMLLGLLIALGPLAWIWLRNRQTSPLRRLQALAVLTLFLTFDLVLFGAFTRLTDSGLGCPDWPGCYGNASPTGAQAEIAAAQETMPTGPVTHGKAWVEMVHRYLATAVGVLIMAMAAASWVQHCRVQHHGGALQPLGVSPWWATFTLLWVCLQGAFGALTVTMKLFPAIVTLHLMGGLILLALLCVQAVHHVQRAQQVAPVPISAGLRNGLVGTVVVLALQILLGGWVSTNYAVLVCTAFPTCQGAWWPDMDFAQGFQIWRGLGLAQDGSYISFAALTAIHYAHRLMAYGVIPMLLWLAWRMYQSGSLAREARWLAALVMLQFATGLSNVVLGWPLVAAVLHTGGAAALVMVVVASLASTRLGATARTSLVPSGASKVSA